MTLFRLQNEDGSARANISWMLNSAMGGSRLGFDDFASAEALAQFLEAKDVIVEVVEDKAGDVDWLWSSTDKKLTRTPTNVSMLPQRARCWVARQADTSPESLASIAENLSKSNISALAEVARNRKTPEDVLDRLSRTEMQNVLSAVAGNPSTPQGTLEVLYGKGGEESILRLVSGGEWSLASNTNTPTWILNELSKRNNINIREKVAGNTSTPSDTLLLLSRQDPQLTGAVASNRSAPPYRLRELALSPTTSNWILYEVAKNPSTHSDALAVLAMHKRPDIKRLAKANPNYHKPARKTPVRKKP